MFCQYLSWKHETRLHEIVLSTMQDFATPPVSRHSAYFALCWILVCTGTLSFSRIGQRKRAPIRQSSIIRRRDRFLLRGRMTKLSAWPIFYTRSRQRWENGLRLEDMVFASDVRDTGLGSQILQHVIQAAAHQWLRASNFCLTDSAPIISAQRFYQRHGFHVSSMLPMQFALHEK